MNFVLSSGKVLCPISQRETALHRAAQLPAGRPRADVTSGSKRGVATRRATSSCRDECMAGAPPEAASAAAARQQLIESRLSWLRSERAKLGEAPTEQAALARWRAESARIASEIRELLREQKLWAIVQEPYVRARLRRERIDRWRLKREAEIAAKRRRYVTLTSHHLPKDPLGGETTFSTLTEQTLREIMRSLGAAGLSQQADGGGDVVLTPDDFHLLEDGQTYHLVRGVVTAEKQVRNGEILDQRKGDSFELEAKRAAVIHVHSKNRSCVPALLSDEAMKALQTGILFVVGERAFVGEAKPVLDRDVLIRMDARERYIRQHADTDPLLAPLRGKALTSILIGERAEDDSLVALWQRLGYLVFLRDGTGRLSPVEA